MDFLLFKDKLAYVAIFTINTLKKKKEHPQILHQGFSTSALLIFYEAKFFVVLSHTLQNVLETPLVLYPLDASSTLYHL